MNDLGSIKITDVAVNVGGLQVLHDVNISASKGDLLALLGPNGCLLYTSPSPRDS